MEIQQSHHARGGAPAAENPPRIETPDQDCLDQVIEGDAREVLKRMPDSSVDAVVTSPPYYRQRDYRHRHQIGAESSPEAYVEQLRDVARSLRRILKPTGALWINLGDKYMHGRLLGLPWRVALALAEDGWMLRSDVIWHKPNAMPAPVKNRPTADHEYLFLLAVSLDYRYFADAIREPHVTFSPQSKMRGGRSHFGIRGGTPEKGKNQGNSNLHDGRWDEAFHPLGRNKRTVWSIPLSKNRQAHFAVFPERLVEQCILATTLPGDVVLDPFAGTGTTAIVARRLDRRYVAIDCVAEYCTMARQRLIQV